MYNNWRSLGEKVDLNGSTIFDKYFFTTVDRYCVMMADRYFMICCVKG